MDIKTKTHFVERSEMINAFFNDVKKYEPLTQAEEEALFKRVKNGDLEARNEILLRTRKFVYSVASCYATDDKVLDLVGEGTIGLNKAIDEYSLDKGVRFLSFAVWFIRREINSFLMNDNLLIRKTNNTKTVYRLAEIRRDFFAQNNRYPEIYEVKDILEKKYGIKIKEDSDLYDVYAYSLNMNYDDEDKNALENSTMITSKTSCENEYNKEVDSEYDLEVISQLMECLDAREREIITCTFGIGDTEAMTIDDIADNLDICKERVRQIKNMALEKMMKYSKNLNLNMA